jgi:hypothetical protein
VLSIRESRTLVGGGGGNDGQFVNMLNKNVHF